IMARSLLKNWKQPVFYDFDTSMFSNILFTVIRYLYEIDYNVVAVTCDMGPSNMRLWNELTYRN
ncbi:Transposable element P transposase, partial [Harpegnathos saltator]